MERLWTNSFIGLTLTLFLLCFGFYLLLPTLPLHLRESGIDESRLGLLVGAFTLTAVVVRPAIGGLADRFGRRVFILTGLILFAIAMILYNWASGIVWLLLLRILHGGGWALSTTSIGTSITDVIPVRRRSEGMGWYGLSMSVSMAIGPIVGVWMVQSYSFRHLTVLAFGLSIASLLTALATRIPSVRSDSGHKAVFFEKTVLPISAAIFFMALTYGGITTFLPLFAESIKFNSGTFFLVYAVALTLARPVAGKLADRYGEGRIMVPSFLLAILGLLVLSLSDGRAGAMVSAALYGIGFGSAQPALQAATLGLVSPKRRGVANASFFTAMDLGIGLGSMLLGFVSRLWGYPVLFAACAASGCLALIIFAGFVKPTLRRGKEDSGKEVHSSSEGGVQP
ncbi:MFS transporter [Cohnella zeiphila]|uniref:MFS transporter n=1 Tax=Cohnella zeiphila TaxID=2761120 RepID=A0A7X0VV51_9BACL|nr:MFS transporter [Cohnella zeiphila]MBB6731586.1 MFS transporter [Cohnella zeiphila]